MGDLLAEAALVKAYIALQALTRLGLDVYVEAGIPAVYLASERGLPPQQRSVSFSPTQELNLSQYIEQLTPLTALKPVTNFEVYVHHLGYDLRIVDFDVEGYDTALIVEAADRRAFYPPLNKTPGKNVGRLKL